MQRGRAAVVVCSDAFAGLARAQSRGHALGELPLAQVAHPFGSLRPEAVAELAPDLADRIARTLNGTGTPSTEGDGAPSAAERIQVPADPLAMGLDFTARGWGDGLPLIAPTEDRVERMLQGTRRARSELIGCLPPRNGAATVEQVAINATMAGCLPGHLPVLLAAVEAATRPSLRLASLQTTTNPSTVAMVVSGPIVADLGFNASGNCMGPGNWTNATLGRALRLVLQNAGGGVADGLDRATHGQPAKFGLCFAEHQAESPWPSLNIERGFAPDASVVTVVGALGTWNMHSTVSDARDLVAVIGDTMQYPASSDYLHGGCPWVVLGPEHAALMATAGWDRATVRERIREASRMRAGRHRGSDLERLRSARRAELGEIDEDRLVPISVAAEDITIVVAGGPGAHSVFMPVSAHSRSVSVAVAG